MQCKSRRYPLYRIQHCSFPLKILHSQWCSLHMWCKPHYPKPPCNSRPHHKRCKSRRYQNFHNQRRMCLQSSHRNQYYSTRTSRKLYCLPPSCNYYCRSYKRCKSHRYQYFRNQRCMCPQSFLRNHCRFRHMSRNLHPPCSLSTCPSHIPRSCCYWPYPTRPGRSQPSTNCSP